VAVRRGKEISLADRLQAAAEARQALIDKARARAPENDPGFAARQAERLAAAAARDARAAERKVAKAAEQARRQAEREAAERERIAAEQVAAERREAERLEAAEQQKVLEAQQKAARDARYAARKARQR
jgi:hypothetical protein